MRYKPVNTSPNELLLKVGFNECISSRGFELKVGDNRMHAYIEGDEINYHYDVSKRHKKHIAHSSGRRCYMLKEIFEFVDGVREKVSNKNRFIN